MAPVLNNGDLIFFLHLYFSAGGFPMLQSKEYGRGFLLFIIG